jgi:sugar phosphate isomerase/epimerase
VTDHQFGVDLVTFFNPAFWGVADEVAIGSYAQANPDKYWARILDSTTQAGISALELTFPPADWRTAVAGAGSVEGFAAELAGRGQKVISGFFNGGSWSRDIDIPAVVEEANAYCDFLSRCGGTALVIGPPMRRSVDAPDPMFVDARYAADLADVFHAVGAATRKFGITTALHTEAHSVFCTSRDVDLFMTMTDPLYVGMCPDTGHLAMAGANPTAVMDRHRARIVLSHWKDVTGPMPLDIQIDENIHTEHRRYFRRVGTGSIDWFAWAALMNEIGFNHTTLLELDATEDPVGEMTAARQYIETSLAVAYGITARPSPSTSVNIRSTPIPTKE